MRLSGWRGEVKHRLHHSSKSHPCLSLSVNTTQPMSFLQRITNLFHAFTKTPVAAKIIPLFLLD